MIEVYYAFAHEDGRLHRKLSKHLSLLVRQQLITTWSPHDVTLGVQWEQESLERLSRAQVILLLVSANFLASEYCYGVELREAIKRHQANEARVIPILLEDCDWDSAPFRHFAILPGNKKPVTMWSNQNAAFANIAKGIRKVVNAMNGNEESDETIQRNEKNVRGGGAGRKNMARTPQSIDAAFLKKVVTQYFYELKNYQEVANYELGLRAAFQNMLASVAKYAGWSLAPEMTIDKIRPDGVLLDEFHMRRGYWEAKGPKVNLEDEISKKIKAGYPLTNTIFENSKQAVLYQGKRRVTDEYDLSNANHIYDLLRAFFTYVEPEIENFEQAVVEFKDRIPEHAAALVRIIDEEHKLNRRFKSAFTAFSEICRSSLDPKMSDATINEMLIQHILTERLFRTVFNNPDFVRRNVIAAEIEKVIDALASRSFNRTEFMRSLDRFYVAIENAAKQRYSWSERQDFLNTVYERFFQGFAVKKADTHGIVYTPQEIVDFMVESVDEVLKKEFGKSIETPGVKILDPATGTGNFIVNIIKRVDEYYLAKKYKEDFFCNEIMLLPYYIASLNIEHEYYEKMGQYEPFEGICFADTLELAEGQQLSLFVEENTERVQREKDADIMVVIGNPPYNAWQKNENDNSKNRKYPIVDQHIRDTYAKDSNATLKNSLYDPYVRFFRWAVDRLQGRDGIVCFVSNNSFVDQHAFDGMRKHLLKDFTQIYHIDLHGNVRKNPKISGTTHNVFGIQVGVGITIAIRNSKNPKRSIYYHRVPEFWRKEEKLKYLLEQGICTNVIWQELQPNSRHMWITEGLDQDFESYLPIGSKEAKLVDSVNEYTVFRKYSRAVITSRDNWAYDFDASSLAQKMSSFINLYNSEVDKWRRLENKRIDVDNFVIYDDTKIKWSGDLKVQLTKGKDTVFSPQKIRNSIYRPFVKKYLYLDSLLNNGIYLQPKFFPITDSETENIVICLTDVGSEKPFMTLASNLIPDLHLVGAGATTQTFPFYTYNEDGTNRRENITDWALKQFQEKYGPQVTKWDIFYYVYSMLHHPQYRELYKENLKRDLPHIPLLLNQESFEACVSVGKQLMELHVNYEQVDEYPLKHVSDRGVPHLQRLRVEKMKLSADKTALVVSKGLTLEGIPQACFEYRLGNRSALEWVIDQYQVSTDKRSGIESDPNRLDDPEYIVRLVKQVVNVSVKTVELVQELTEAVSSEDWLGEVVVEELA